MLGLYFRNSGIGRDDWHQCPVDRPKVAAVINCGPPHHEGTRNLDFTTTIRDPLRLHLSVPSALHGALRVNIVKLLSLLRQQEHWGERSSLWKVA